MLISAPAPSNLSPASDIYAEKIAQRVERLQAAYPEQAGAPVPVDLVTCSGSGLDPHISLAAAQYQLERLARENHMTEEQINLIIGKCTTHPLMGIFGAEGAR